MTGKYLFVLLCHLRFYIDRSVSILLFVVNLGFRMRNATIMIVGLKGVATETAKNLVLAGIGKLIVADEKDVSEEDLGANFFLREEDVGKKVIRIPFSLQKLTVILAKIIRAIGPKKLNSDDIILLS